MTKYSFGEDNFSSFHTMKNKLRIFHISKGTVDQRMKKLKEYSQRYEGKQIWLTEFAIAREPNVTKIVEFVEGE